MGAPLDLAKLREQIETIPPVGSKTKPNKPVVANRVYAATLLNSFDSNRDGVLTKEDKQAKWLMALDNDGDRKVNVNELSLKIKILTSETLNNHHPEPTRTGLSQLLPAEFKQLDTNEDGQIQMFEFADAWTGNHFQRFKKRDTNQDGLISQSEWNAYEARELENTKEPNHD